MKGLILCAGKGTRLQPLSLSQPKALLPIANKPMIYYSIAHLVELNIHDVGIVINRTQESVFREKLGTGDRFGISITYIYQEQPRGIADAVKQAELFINKEPFLLLLGDNLICESLSMIKESVEQQLNNGSIILTHVDNPQEYGVAEIEGELIVCLEEKPKFPKSNLAVVGAYAFDQTIFDAIHSISPSARGEYEITDAIQWLISQGYQVTYSITNKKISDVGTVERFLEANRMLLDSLKNQNGVSDIPHKDSTTNCKIIPPVLIAPGCHLKDSVIGPYVSIGSDVIIEGCHIEHSILLEGARLHNIPYRIQNSIFGQNSTIIGYADEFNSTVEYILGDKSSVLIKK